MTPVLPFAGQNVLRYVEGYVEFFKVFQKLYLFIVRLMLENVMIFYAIVIGKHCSKESRDVYENVRFLYCCEAVSGTVDMY